MNADAQNQELMRLYRIRKTVLKMLTKRGYNELDQTLNATFQTFAVRVPCVRMPCLHAHMRRQPRHLVLRCIALAKTMAD